LTINSLLIKFTFHTMLKKRAYRHEGVAQLAARSRFERGDVRLDSIAFELWPHKPA
jgi:hypothetical protein